MTGPYKPTGNGGSAIAAAPVIELSDVGISFAVGKQTVTAVDGISFALRRGEVLALVGESGSGKSTTAMAIPGLLASTATVTGSIRLDGQELVGASESTFQKIRGAKVAVIFQEPMTALNPVYTIGWQIREALQAHLPLSKAAANARAVELLKLVDMPDPEVRVKYYPHQLSGGQRQRAMIAQALACDPEVLIADEPTTALDVTVQAEILELMRDLRNRIDAAILLITHDMGVVADMADRIAVMKDGKLVEVATSREIFNSPQHDYTKKLLASVPHLGGSGVEVNETDRVAEAEADRPAQAFALEVDDVSIVYGGRGGSFKAVDSVSFDIKPGEVVGLVGESGSGKSTIGKAAIGLVKVASGSIKVAGTDIATASRTDLRAVRQKIGVVFQDPGSSLNPRWPIGQAIAEPIALYHSATKKERERQVEELLDAVELSKKLINRFPHELSGGQRQRVGIARALALRPTLLIADEPTSALDVSVQARVLELFQGLQKEYGFACLFVSHDLAVVEILASRIAVLSKGTLAEFGERDQVLTNPTSDYTKRLLAAVPVPDPDEQAARRTERRRLLEAGSVE